jgi:hypothetical protein
MKKKRVKDAREKEFSFPVWAEFLITKVTAIKKATYILKPSGSVVDIGIFQLPIEDYRLGAFLHRDADGNVCSGTVCKFKEKDPSGEEWFQGIQRSFLGSSLQ